MKDPESPVYQPLRGATSTEDVPFAVKRNVIDLHNFVERCKEEKNYLHVEMCRLIEHYESEKSKLHGFIEEYVEESTLPLSGLKCVFQKRIFEYDNKLYQLRLLFADHLSHEILSRLPDKQHSYSNIVTHRNEVNDTLLYEVEGNACEEDYENKESSSEMDDSDSDDDLVNF